MSDHNYWTRLATRRLSRRALMAASTKAGVGAAGLALVGCGDDDDDDAVSQAPSGDAADQSTDQAADQADDQATPADDADDDAAVAQVADEKQGGTFRMANNADAFHLDFSLRIDVVQAWNTNMVYGKMLEYTTGEGWGLEHSMAEAVETPSDTETVLTLRPNIFFHDKPPVNGRQMTSADAVTHIDYIMGSDPPAQSFAFGPVDRVEPIDDLTVKYVMSQPFAFFQDYLADTYAGNVMAREVLDQEGDLREVAIGTGAFQHDEWEKNVALRLSRHPKYFGNPMPYLDAIELLVTPDLNTQLAEFRTGGTHNLGGTLGWPSQLRDTVRDTIDGVVELTIPNLGNQGPLLNSNRFPDQRLRQSVSLGLNRPDLLNLYEDAILSGPVSAGFGDLVMGAENFVNWQNDPQKARNLLDAAGYADGISMDMLIGPYAGSYLLLAEACVTQLRDVGWNIDIFSPPYADWIGDFFTEPNHDIAMGTTSPRPPVDFQVWGHYNSASGGNFVHSTDPQLDVLTDAVRNEVDNDERALRLVEFQEYIADQAYWATTVLEPRHMFIQSNVRDMRRGAGAAFFANTMQPVWLDEV